MLKVVDNSNKSIIVWIENLRAISAMAVILLHVSAQMTYSFGKVPNIEWWASNLYTNINRFCVPVFVMITGILTLGKDYKLSEFFKKKIPRILIPFIFWSLVYILYDLVIGYYKSHEVLGLGYTINFTLKKLAFGASYHMWYIYMLIGIYLIHPIINKWIIHSSSKEQIYFLLLCLFSLLLKYYPFSLLQTSISLNFFSEFLGYLVLGYFLFNANSKINKKKILYATIFLFFLSYAIICYDTYISSIKEGAYTEKFEPWVILQVISIFLLFKIFKIFNKKNKILSIISKYSYGIYLIHVLIMDILAKAGLAYYSFNPYFSIPITFICTLLLSTLLLYALDKLSFGKYIVK